MDTKPYLLTGGLVPLIENRHKIPLGDNTKEAIRYIERSYSNSIASLLSNRIERDPENNPKFRWEVKFISDITIEEELSGLINSNKSIAQPIVSFDDVYCQNLANVNYHVTRIQNPSNLNEEPKLGSRFSFLDLDTQVENVRRNYGKSIDIMDIGAFGGATLLPEIKRFRDKGVNIENIYLMFVGQEALEKLSNENLNIFYSKTFDWIDWLEIRDCMGFDGRKVPLNPNDLDAPQNSFIRYTEKSKEWASIPEDVKTKYDLLYDSSFNQVREVLASEGIDVSLKPSNQNKLVHHLRIKKK
jgi:hypothetical protein